MFQVHYAATPVYSVQNKAFLIESTRVRGRGRRRRRTELVHNATPAPINLHLSVILLLIATRLRGIRQTGFLSFTSILTSLTLTTVPRVAAVPIFRRSGSLALMGSTLTMSSVPTAVSKRCTSTEMSSTSSGKASGFPTTDPIRESLFTKVGSNFVPIATSPPGLTFSTRPAPVPSVEMVELIGSYLPFFSSKKPGRI